MAAFEEIRKETVADRVARQIRRLILNDELPPGARLPPERELAQRLGTNRNTLREAVRLLVDEGLVSVKHGGGMEVLDHRRSGGIQLLAHYLRDVEDPVRRAAFIGDALSLRKTALGLVARFAAQKLTPAGERALGEAMQRVRQAVASGGDVPGADVGFLAALGLATGSTVLCWVINTMADITDGLLRDRRLWGVEDDYVEKLQAVCDAVLRRDPAAAEAALAAHFEAADAALAARLGALSPTGG